MKTNLVATGVFVISAVLLFGAGLFLVGDRQNAFSRHHDFYTEMSNVNGLAPGSKVRISGFDAGEVISMQIPDRPSEKFRIKLHADKKLNNLIREDSVVSVESEGIVGDKFLASASTPNSSSIRATSAQLKQQMLRFMAKDVTPIRRREGSKAGRASRLA